jgi:carbohydrate-selective porin OprB
LAVGVHHHTGDFEGFDEEVRDGLTGVYALAEQQVWRFADGGSEGERGAFVFVQAGSTDDEVSAAAHHASAGLTLAGLLDSRARDTTGVYVSWVGTSDVEEAGFTDDEVSVEVYYKAWITGSVNVTPDLQFISSPGGGGVDDAWVGQVRAEVLF